MKRIIAAIVTSLVLILGISGVGYSGATTGGLVNEEYGFEYVITEIKPSNISSRATIVLASNSMEHGDHFVGFSIFKADFEVDPYGIGIGRVPAGSKSVSNVGGVPISAGSTLLIGGFNIGAQNNSMAMGEGESMEFYYIVSLDDRYVQPQGWSGGRKVSYESCARDGKFREGMVCRVREQIDGVFYYDAWIGDVNYSEKVRLYGADWEEEEARRAEEERLAEEARREEEERLREEERRAEEERWMEEMRREEERRLEEERVMEEMRREEERRWLEEERLREEERLAEEARLMEVTRLAMIIGEGDNNGDDERVELASEEVEEEGGKGADGEVVDESLRAPVTGGGEGVLEFGWVGWGMGAILMTGRKVVIRRNKRARMSRLGQKKGLA